MDGDKVFAEDVLFDLYDLKNIDIPTKENHVLEGIYTDAECTKAFGNENVSDILLHGADNLCLYTKWIEVVPVDWTLESQGEYYFAQSGNTWTSNNQGMSNTSATATWTVTLENDVYVYIPWSVSSESSYDKLTVTLDSNKIVNAVSGDKSGTIETTLSAGTHTLSATYSKDSSQDNGSDCATITLNEIVY